MPEEPRFLDLNIEDLAPLGGTVHFGDRDYQLRSPDGMNLTEISKLQQCEKILGKAMRALQVHPDDQKSSKEAEDSLNILIGLIMPDLPAEELAKLGYLKKTKIFAFFNGRLGAYQDAMKGITEPASLQTTPTLSPV
jgi:hypothetical protein